MAVSDYITGYDHVGIPSNDMEATKKFFEALGFKVAYETTTDVLVRFFQAGPVIIETFDKKGQAAGKRGAIDHIALAVDDLDKAYEEVKKTGYPVVEGPAELPFWEKGVRYFVIEGPDKEAVEFSQKF